MDSPNNIALFYFLFLPFEQIEWCYCKSCVINFQQFVKIEGICNFICHTFITRPNHYGLFQIIII